MDSRDGYYIGSFKGLPAANDSDNKGCVILIWMFRSNLFTFLCLPSQLVEPPLSALTLPESGTGKMSFWRNKITDALVKRATDGYVEACTYPTISSARFQKEHLIHSVWSQKSPEIGKKRLFSKLFALSPAGSESTCLGSTPIRHEESESISAFGTDKDLVISKVSSKIIGRRLAG